jgi:ABC-type lipoprotein export system ATPase subunit
MNCFEVRNLVCSYDNIHPVLYIPELDIPRGRICVLFGQSGSGKSTLLETLGLMTNSIALRPEPYKIIFENQESTYDLDKIRFSIKFFKNHKVNEKTGNREDLEEFYLNHTIGEIAEATQAQQRKRWPGSRKWIGLNDFIWNDPVKQKELRDFHFSFIFQDTNLMPNFTSVYNTAIPEMLTLDESLCPVGTAKNCAYGDLGKNCDQKAETCALIHAQHTLLNVDLDSSQLNRVVLKLSGGQRQRVAFARAKNSRSTILFGDEPTGNLDKVKSENLMLVIRDLIREDPNKCALVVSHDLNLTLKYADQIFCLKTVKYHLPGHKEPKEYGIILKENIFRKTSPDDEAIRWSNAVNGDSEQGAIKEMDNMEMQDYLIQILGSREKSKEGK